MSFLFYNVNGKRRFFDNVNSNKSDRLSSKHADINQFDFVCLSETWDCSPTAVLPRRGFIFSPASREGRNRGRPSGGLEIYFNPSFAVEKKSTTPNHLVLTINNFISIIFIYYQPDFDFSLMIEDLAIALQSSGSHNIILAGDFNLHVDESNFDELSKFLSSHNIVLCSDPTKTTFMHMNGGTSTPDFIFSSLSLLSAEHKTAVHDNIDSDHFPLSFILNPASLRQINSINKFKLDIDKCSDLLKNKLPSLKNSIPDETVTSLNKIFQDSLTEIRSPHSLPPRWTSPEIKNTKKLAKFHLKKFQVSSNDEDKKKFLQARNKVSRLIKKAKRDFRLNETNNMILAGRAKGLAALYKYAKPYYNNISTQISIDDWKKFYTNLFQSHDKSVFHPVSFPPSESASFLTSPFTLSEIKLAIKSQKSSAPSLEHFSPANCKTLDDQLAPFLLKIFNAILNGEIEFPSAWLSSVFFFLHKKGSMTDPSNYRSLAIENPFLKIFMWLLNFRLTEYVECNKLLPDLQFGFRKGHSAPSAAFLLQEAILKGFNSNSKKEKKIFSCFVDFKKAFDSVHRGILFDKLINKGIPSQFAVLVMDILSNIRLHVKSNDSISDSFSSFNGVLQGDPISPLLFSLFIADLPCILKSKGIGIGNFSFNHILYADDLVLLSNSPEDLQKDLDSLANYCDNNHLTVSIGKTKCLPFYRGRFDSIPTFFYKTVPLENVKEFKYLGITFTTQISATKHIDRIISKCNSVLAQLFFKLKIEHATLPLALRIFKTYIQPIIEYGLPVWLPRMNCSSKYKIDALFTKFLKRFFCIPYCSDNSIVYYLSRTSPLSSTLHSIHLKRFLSLNFPNVLSGLNFNIPSEKSDLPPPNFDDLPSYFKASERISLRQIPLDPSSKRTFLYDKMDIIHYSICRDKKFHSPSVVGIQESSCICKFCKQKADHYHHRRCPHLKHLSLKALMAKIKGSL